MPLRELFVDCNAFFASCEQHLRPELRGRALGVVPVLAETGCCIAASIEARPFGVKTGTLVYEARKLCPHIQFVEARPKEYVQLHHCIVEIVEAQMHVEHIHSIDEMSCRLTGRWCEPDRARALARQIKMALRRDLGPVLRCSIGLAPNLFLAKTASDMQKPDGLVVLDLEDLPQALHGLELSDLCGIGRHMERRLRAARITTVEELCAASREKLRSVWGGVGGERFWAWLRGDDFAAAPTRKSVFGHSHVLAPALRTEAAARAVAHRLLEKAAMRLRAADYFAGELQAYLRYPRGQSWEDARSLEPTQDTVEFARTLDLLLDRRTPREDRAGPIQVGVNLLRLTHACDNPLPLFPTESTRRLPLMRVVDRLNRVYGFGAIHWGSAHAARAAAPMRIAFNRIPSLENEDTH